MKRIGLNHRDKTHTLIILAMAPLIVLGCMATDMLDAVSTPEVKIISPINPSTVEQGTTVELSVSMVDTIKPRDVIWSSSLDGWLGKGHRIEVSDLSIGIHRILVTVIDSGNMYRPRQTLTDSVSLEVVEKKATQTDILTTSFDIHQCNASAAISEVVTLDKDSASSVGRNCTFTIQATNNSDQKVRFYHYATSEKNDQSMSQTWLMADIMPGETKMVGGWGVYWVDGRWSYILIDKLMAIYVNEDCLENIDYNDEAAYEDLFAWEIQTYCAP